MARSIMLLPMLFVFLGCQFGAQTKPIRHQTVVEAANAADPMAIKLKPPESPLKRGQEIMIHIDLRVCCHELALPEGPSTLVDFNPELILPNGRVVTVSPEDMTPAGLRYYESNDCGSAHVRRVTSGWGMQYDYPLSKLFDLSAAGIYRVRFRRFSLLTNGSKNDKGKVSFTWSDTAQFLLE